MLLHGIAGFDLDKKKFVGTWVVSMSTNLWKYEGALVESAQAPDH